MKKSNILNYFFAIFSVILVAGLGTLFTNLGMDYFDNLTKPTMWIAPFVIPVMWTVIYICFAIYLIFAIKNIKLTTKSIVLLIINGFLNVLWCLVFFTLKQLFIGEIVIILNALFAYLLLVDIKKSYKLFSYILVIYPIWLSLATFLNTAVWILN